MCVQNDGGKRGNRQSKWDMRNDDKVGSTHSSYRGNCTTGAFEEIDAFRERGSFYKDAEGETLQKPGPDEAEPPTQTLPVTSTTVDSNVRLRTSSPQHHHGHLLFRWLLPLKSVAKKKIKWEQRRQG